MSDLDTTVDDERDDASAVSAASRDSSVSSDSSASAPSEESLPSEDSVLDEGIEEPEVAPTATTVASAPVTAEEIQAAVESLLYLATEPLAVDVMAELIGAEPEEVGPAVLDLQQRYVDQGRGLALREVGIGWRMSTAPGTRHVVERFVLAGRSGRLTQAALETLAVVAYKQPIQRADVSDIRGVNADGAIRSLVARGLLQELGRAEAPGQPILYGTTPMLLEKLGLTSLNELPDIADHLPDAAPDEPRLDDLSRARRLIAEGRDLPATGRSSWDPDAPPPMPAPTPRRSAGGDDAMDELSDRLEAAAKSAMKRLQEAVSASERPDPESDDPDDNDPADPTDLAAPTIDDDAAAPAGDATPATAPQDNDDE